MSPEVPDPEGRFVGVSVAVRAVREQDARLNAHVLSCGVCLEAREHPPDFPQSDESFVPLAIPIDVALRGLCPTGKELLRPILEGYNAELAHAKWMATVEWWTRRTVITGGVFGSFAWLSHDPAISGVGSVLSTLVLFLIASWGVVWSAVSRWLDPPRGYIR